jgi:hypothetical protein
MVPLCQARELPALPWVTCAVRSALGYAAPSNIEVTEPSSKTS